MLSGSAMYDEDLKHLNPQAINWEKKFVPGNATYKPSAVSNTERKAKRNKGSEIEFMQGTFNTLIKGLNLWYLIA